MPPTSPNLLHSEFASTRAVWTAPLPGETGAPSQRIIHHRVLNFPSPARIERVGWREGNGYCKCGSAPTRDSIRALRILAWNGGEWRLIHDARDLRAVGADELQWLELGIETSALCIEIRRCTIDGWWPSWNLASSALVVEGAASGPTQPEVRSLQLAACDLAGLPDGVTAEHLPGEMRYRTPFIEVGFRLGRPGFSYISVDDSGQGTHRNLLRQKAEWRNPLCEYCVQGIRHVPVGAAALAAFFHYLPTGTTTVRGNCVSYDVHFGDDLAYHLVWEVRPKSLHLTVERSNAKPLRAWHSGAWHVAFDAAVTQTTALGTLHRGGETGALALPLLLHAPGSGTLQISARSGRASWRCDAARPCLVTTGELKLGEVPQPEGDYLLEAGTHRAEIDFTISEPCFALPAAPESVQRAVERCSITAFPFRADTATLANNGVSIHVPLCMDTWASLAALTGPLGAGVDAMDLVRVSLERWLDGAPGYASGVSPGGSHLMEDEYLMTGVSCLCAAGVIIRSEGGADFAREYGMAIVRQVELLHARDHDGDGLIESPHRTGVSGSAQWSTNWYDAISFGWKDAFTNALLYRTLAALGEAAPRLTGTVDVTEWMRKLKENYLATFMNPETGWLAGWRCKEDRLHDYAFLPVNGAAVACGLVPPAAAREIMRRLWLELHQGGPRDFRLGLPGNLWPLPAADVAAPLQGKPFGFFENGGLTHAQAHHFVEGLIAVGMDDEADELLRQLCASLADASAFGGCGTDVEWRSPDGAPCGYEGLLCDQFGVLATVLAFYHNR